MHIETDFNGIFKKAVMEMMNSGRIHSCRIGKGCTLDLFAEE
jgi:hypothetical protein